MSEPAAAIRLPLTSVQEGMLFHSDLYRGSGVYTEQLSLDLLEALDPDTFREAWRRVAARHELLRASFHRDASEGACLRIHGDATPSWELLDWADRDPAGQDTAWAALLDRDRGQTWDFSRPPLMRFVLVRLGAEQWRLLWSFHHALMDGGSFARILGEVYRVYRGLGSGEPPELTEPRPFGDYVAWLEARDQAEDQAYWSRALGDFCEPLAPGEPAGDAAFSHGEMRAALPTELSEHLRLCADAHGLTMTGLVLGAWALLLHRLTGSEDVVFGVTLSTQWSRPDDRRVAVGPFINTLPLRVPVPPDAEVLPWLTDVQARWNEMRRHGRTPLLEAQRSSGVPAGRPLFETIAMYGLWNMEQGVAEELRGGAWRARVAETLDTPLTMAVLGRRRMEVKIGYDERRFDAGAIARLHGHYRTLLEGLVSRPDARLGDLPTLTGVEQQTMLHDWNAATCEVPGEVCLHELFEAWAGHIPDAPAVVFEGARLTYGQLEARAGRLAGHLRALGVGPEVRVGICVERSLEMVVGLLAILKAGGAFVPLHPDEPAERLASMLDQARVPVLLTQSHLRSTLPPGPHRVLVLDEDGAETWDGKAPSGSTVRPENLAYVIFTSGSTGRPKGVMVTHRNVVGFLHAYQHVTLDPVGRIGTNVAPNNFDVSIEEIWSCLCFGGTVHIVRPEHSADGATFARYLLEHGITTTYIAPAMLVDVARHLAGQAEALRLRCLLTGVHAKKESALQAFRDLLPGLRIINAYGPTETTYGATAYEFTQAQDPDRDVPIGVPFPGYQIYIVDPRLQPVPIGIPGELLIGGLGVARGYLDLPEQTRAAFIPDPWGPDRLYRTGDRCRYRADGVIEFLGRKDHQVKIRGYRVELGEIEGALERHPAVQECAVAAAPDAHGGLRLVAYLAGAPVPSSLELRTFLRGTLPEYMVPALFQVVEALPRTSAGKVDRRALLDPGPIEPPRDQEPATPRTGEERLLATIWADVLKRSEVGIHDDFFELGGQSLLAVQVIARIRRERGIDLPLRQLFERPTIARLAPLLAASPAARAITPLARRVQKL